MKTTLTTLSLLAVSLIAASAATAQTGAFPPPAPKAPVAYDHASTLEEGMLRGGGALLEGIGNMNYNNAAAAVIYQEAVSRALDNRLKQTATYFDQRKLNREARAEERGQRVTAEQLAHIARERAPDRLAAFHFDAARRRLVWPDVFNHPYFDEERATIDRLMSVDGGAGPESREIQLLAGQMEAKLRNMTQARQVPGYAYGPAKRFITSLQFEMNFAPAAAGIAAR